MRRWVAPQRVGGPAGRSIMVTRFVTRARDRHEADRLPSRVFEAESVADAPGGPGSPRCGRPDRRSSWGPVSMVRSSSPPAAKVGRIHAPVFGPPRIEPQPPSARTPSRGYARAMARFASLRWLLPVVVSIAACSVTAPSFDPAAPCLRDDRGSALYPELEAQIPAEFQGRPADRVDSGRNCTARSLGLLLQRGVPTIEFAGGLWETGGRSGVTIALFRADGLQARDVFDFYKAGALAAPKTDATTEGSLLVAGTNLPRLDTLNDESFQTVIVATGRSPGLVRIVLVASAIRDVVTREAHEAMVDAAVSAALASG